MSSRYQKLATNEEEENIALNESSSRQIPAHNRPEQQQLSDLQDSFGESFDHEDDDLSETHQLLVPGNNESSSSISHMDRNRPAVLPVSTNDGVFSNMAAKPESMNNKVDETPPTYEEAAADATPPYWQTTIIAPAGMGDMVLVEGLPVGNILSFFWNLLISASFQFVGFMLTYLLHTSHASKQGSRAGLGVSLVQTGFYIRSRGTLEDDYYYNTEEEQDKASSEDSVDADIIAYFLMMLGWLIIIRALADYFKAKQMEKIITAEPSAEAMV
ncbi:hypothetical protein K501DRAFT_218407 [Backusella circina FSU 941]|nr:hypothetical protein K501DRAFT_218407 [Backusella circina FSU 941]